MLEHRILWLIVPFLLASGVVCAGPVEEGIAAYARSDFARARKLLSGPAEAGDPIAQFNMGGLAQAGHGNNSARWFERAMAQGHADSFVALGLVYLQGKERRKNVDEAFRLFKEGADRGSSQGLLYLSRHYEAGLLVPRDPRRADALRRKSAAAGNADAAYLIEKSRASRTVIDADAAAWMGKFGRGEEAFALRLSAAETGDPEAQMKVAIHYRDGLGVKKNIGEALRWNRAAAKQGNTEAIYAMGLYYYNGWGVDRDRSIALDWFRQAQAKGHPYAANSVALLTAPPPRAGGGGSGSSDLDTYMRLRRDSCFLVGGNVDQYGTCR